VRQGDSIVREMLCEWTLIEKKVGALWGESLPEEPPWQIGSKF